MITMYHHGPQLGPGQTGVVRGFSVRGLFPGKQRLVLLLSPNPRSVPPKRLTGSSPGHTSNTVGTGFALLISLDLPQTRV